MWGVAKIFTSGHSKGGSTEPLEPPLATGMPSFKNTGKYSTIVALAKSSGHVAGGKCNCKAGGGGCCKHVAALLYNILDYTELGLNEIPPDKTCTELPQQWHKPKNITYNGPALFSEIQFVHHVYGK